MSDADSATYGPNDELSALLSWGFAVRTFANAKEDGIRWEWERHAPSLRSARLIEVDIATANRMVDDFDYYVESSGVNPFHAVDSMRRTQRPPFGSVFIGLRLSLDGQHKDHPYPMGWLVSADSYLSLSLEADLRESGWIRRIIFSDLENKGGVELFSNEGRHPGAAVFPELLFQLMERDVHVVCESKLMPSQREMMRDAIGRKGARNVPVPRAYHKILVTGSTTWLDANRKAIVAAGHRWKLQHRIDVRAHWWVRVREGDGLVPAEMRERLDSSYVWIDDDNPDIDQETWELIASRGVQPRQHGRWMGILKRWIGPHQRGPADGPYVPALWAVEPSSTAHVRTERCGL